MNVTEELRNLRERAGLSQAEIAHRLGYKGQSSYQRYEDATFFKKRYLDREFVEKLVPILTNRGVPAIVREEVLRLAGGSPFAGPDTKLAASVNYVEVKGPSWIPILKAGQVMTWMNGNLPDDGITKYTDASHDNPGKKSFVLEIYDDSLLGDGIKAGDRIVCDPDKPQIPGRIVVALVTLKAAAATGEDNQQQCAVIGHYNLRRDDAGDQYVEISPTNAAYPSRFIDKRHPGRIIGPAVELRKKL